MYTRKWNVPLWSRLQRHCLINLRIHCIYKPPAEKLSFCARHVIRSCAGSPRRCLARRVFILWQENVFKFNNRFSCKLHLIRRQRETVTQAKTFILLTSLYKGVVKICTHPLLVFNEKSLNVLQQWHQLWIAIICPFLFFVNFVCRNWRFSHVHANKCVTETGNLVVSKLPWLRLHIAVARVQAIFVFYNSTLIVTLFCNHLNPLNRTYFCFNFQFSVQLIRMKMK